MKTLLVLTDFSEKSEHATDFAFRMAEDLNSSILLFNAYVTPQAYVVEGGGLQNFDNDVSLYEKTSRMRLESVEDRLRSKVHRSGDNNTPEISLEHAHGTLEETLPQVQEKHEDIGMIVLGDKSTEGFYNQLIFGSETQQVLQTAKYPVILIPEKAHYHNFKKIAIAVSSFTEIEVRALDFLTRFADRYDSEIVIIHISPEKTNNDEVEKQLAEIRRMQARVNYERITYHVIKDDDVAIALIKFIKNFEVMLLGLIMKKHSLLERLVSSSNVKKIMEYHKVPLLIFPDTYK